MKVCLTLWVLFLLGGPLVIFAQDYPIAVPTKTEVQIQEFDQTRIIYAEGDVFGLHFFRNSKEIGDSQQMDKLIYSGGDVDAIHAWRRSEAQRSLGWVFIAGGGGLIVTGGILSWQKNNDNNLCNYLVFGGLALDVVGGLLWREAQGSQLSAVDHYNAAVREENGFTLMDLKGRGTALAWVQRF